jgi:chemotaxis protein methyltransferase CheR
MNERDFATFADILKRRSGLALTDDKMYLLESRLLPVAKKHNHADLSALANALRMNPPESLLVEITEAMTTNESMFFRDKTPFDQFTAFVLPRVMEATQARKNLRIWSAACSNGQEPYSLVMLLKEQGAKMAGWNYEIIGTDIDNQVLVKAREAIYTQFEVQRGLPVTMLVKYFTQNGTQWQVKPEIRDMVKYKYLNLIDPMTGMGQFDVIFCRNVLIYFDKETKRAVLQKLVAMMPPHAVLYLGSAESVMGIADDVLKPIEGQRGLFERK